MKQTSEEQTAADVDIILDAFRRIVQMLRQASRHSERLVGLGAAQLFVLRTMFENEAPISINDLAEKTSTHQSSVSVVVTKLASSKLIKRVPSATDGRSVQVKLTAKGHKLLESSPPLVQDQLSDAISRLSARERKGLVTGLGALMKEAGLLDGRPNLFFEEGKTK